MLQHPTEVDNSLPSENALEPRRSMFLVQVLLRERYRFLLVNLYFITVGAFFYSLVVSVTGNLLPRNLAKNCSPREY